jgi:hypothetical protein
MELMEKWETSSLAHAFLAECFFSNSNCMKALELAPKCGFLRPPGVFGAVKKIVLAWPTL